MALPLPIKQKLLLTLRLSQESLSSGFPGQVLPRGAGTTAPQTHEHSRGPPPPPPLYFSCVPRLSLFFSIFLSSSMELSSFWQLPLPCVVLSSPFLPTSMWSAVTCSSENLCSKLNVCAQTCGSVNYCPSISWRILGLHSTGTCAELSSPPTAPPQIAYCRPLMCALPQFPSLHL